MSYIYGSHIRTGAISIQPCDTCHTIIVVTREQGQHQYNPVTILNKCINVLFKDFTSSNTNGHSLKGLKEDVWDKPARTQWSDQPEGL